MPYKQHEGYTEYQYEEYPKMLVKKVQRPNDPNETMEVPEIYPPGHVKQGLPVIFENADEEAAYKFPAKSAKKAKAKDDE